MEAAAKIILDYWFGGLKDGWTADDRLALWFGSQAEDDEDMRRRFGALIDEAVAGRLDSWSNDDGGGLALILLTDQMTRSTRRGDSRGFCRRSGRFGDCRTRSCRGAGSEFAGGVSLVLLFAA